MYSVRSASLTGRWCSRSPKAVRSGEFRYRPGCLPRCVHMRGLFPSVTVTLPWAESNGQPVTVQLLVSGEGGQVYTGDLFHKVVWQGAFRTADLEYRTRADGMHALRHFYAST